MKTMKQDITELLKVSIINGFTFITTSTIDLESLLKYTLYFVSIVYTVFKIIKMIADRLEYKKSKKEIKKKD